MAELEEKLNAILGDPRAMGQIMELARSLSGGEEGTGKSGGPDQPAAEPEASREAGPDPSAQLGQLDPDAVRRGMRLLLARGGEDSRSAALLSALKPFLKEERYAKVDQAVKIARLSRVIRVAFQLFRERNEGGERGV